MTCPVCSGRNVRVVMLTDRDVERCRDCVYERNLSLMELVMHAVQLYWCAGCHVTMVDGEDKWCLHCAATR